MNSRRGVIGVGVVATVFLLLVSSCTSRKKLVSPMAHAADYEWMSAKMTIEISSADTTLSSHLSPLTLSGILRMKRDSIVWISASALMGMESIRALITQDSVVMINRINQTYLAEPMATVMETVQVPSLRECQAMLLGNGVSDHVEIKTGPYMAKIKYSDIQWDTPLSFPIKINKKYERMKL